MLDIILYYVNQQSWTLTCTFMISNTPFSGVKNFACDTLACQRSVWLTAQPLNKPRHCEEPL
ncbi:hypothetical protein SAMN04488028_10125 [Reichenbachiella agariperforans]|uniref:Uncharacterized protein n=1 Tax=Reichenbachiella agariperforans TaxID=156994 RepID=A0A1M6J3C8_REIAG|nr:hypothetical protein SAMN04488028_10125 [Reichenbachiella agariperforans]